MFRTQTPEKVQQAIRADYNNGDSIEAICARHGITDKTVYKYTADLRTKVGGVWKRNSELEEVEADEDIINLNDNNMVDLSGMMDKLKGRGFVKVVFDIERNKVILQKLENVMIDLNA